MWLLSLFIFGAVLTPWPKVNDQIGHSRISTPLETKSPSWGRTLHAGFQPLLELAGMWSKNVFST